MAIISITETNNKNIVARKYYSLFRRFLLVLKVKPQLLRLVIGWVSIVQPTVKDLKVCQKLSKASFYIILDMFSKNFETYRLTLSIAPQFHLMECLAWLCLTFLQQTSQPVGQSLLLTYLNLTTLKYLLKK